MYLTLVRLLGFDLLLQVMSFPSDLPIYSIILMESTGVKKEKLIWEKVLLQSSGATYPQTQATKRFCIIYRLQII